MKFPLFDLVIYLYVPSFLLCLNQLSQLWNSHHNVFNFNGITASLPCTIAEQGSLGNVTARRGYHNSLMVYV